MKNGFLIVIFFFVTRVAVCSCSYDSLPVDKEKIEKVISEIKQKEIPKHYGIFSEDYSIFDITFNYPNKIHQTERPWIEVKWKNEIIYIYALNSTTYKIELVIDLR